LAFGPLLIAFDAHAEPKTITIRGREPNLHFVIFRDDDTDGTDPAATCEEPCIVTLPPGSYRLKTIGPPGADIRTSETAFEVRQDTAISVDPATNTGRTLGLAAGIAGTAVFAVSAVGLTATGVGILMADSARCIDRPGTGGGQPGSGQPGCAPVDNSKAWAWAGAFAGGMVVGAVTAVIGFRAFARNGGPTLEVGPAAPSATSGVTFGFGPTPGGFGAAGSIRF
jgi:hypothetical protein